MKTLKIVRYAQNSNEKITLTLRGHIRISTTGVLQIFTEADYNHRANGDCILALPESEWLSAEVMK